MENKIELLGYLYNARQALYHLDLDDADYAVEQIDKAIVSIGQELVDYYREHKHVNKLSE